jgi:UPF0755 protein
MPPEDWISDDPFVDPTDPASVDRARRRQEREARRRQREEAARAQEPAAEEAAAAAGPPPAAQEPAPPPPPPGPSLADRFGSVRERAGERWAQRRAAPRRHRSGGAATLLRPATVALALAGLLLLWFLWAFFQPFHGDGSGRVMVKIPKGASVSDVGDLLDEEGVVSSSALFQGRVTLAGKRSELYPGTYTLASGMSYGDAIDALSTPPIKRTIVISIPEGLSRAQVAPLVRDAGVEGDYMKLTERFDGFIARRYGAKGAENLEGFLFPATYELPAKANVEDLVARQLDAFSDRIAGIDMSYAKSKKLNVYDVIIIASMIEREVQVPAERKLVAAVIYNRLRQGMPLGIDATTRFAVGNYTEPLSPSDLEIDSPYNTRLYGGLPPGPIGNPGEAAIRAAAHPARVDYTYYVVEPYTCGEHTFSSSYAEFEQDAAAYNDALEKEGKAPTRC